MNQECKILTEFEPDRFEFEANSLMSEGWKMQSSSVDVLNPNFHFCGVFVREKE